MRKKAIVVTFFMVGSLLSSYSQQKNNLVSAEDETSSNSFDTSRKYLKDILSQLQDLYKVNILYETKLEEIPTSYQINSKGKNLDHILKELLTPLMLKSVKIDNNNYVIKTIQASSNEGKTEAVVTTTVLPDFVAQVKDSAFQFKNQAILQEVNASSSTLIRYADTLKNTRTITGRIFGEENHEPVATATIYVAGTKYHAFTDTTGRFSIAVPAGSKILTISQINYEPLSVQLNPNNNNLNIVLKSRAELLNASVISTGIFTRRKEAFTGAVSTFTGEQLKLIGNQNVLQSLKTLDPSFIILDNDLQGSNPNAAPQIQLRGATTMPSTTLTDMFTADPNLPLFVLDGFVVPMQRIIDMDMNRVASVTILKDAATAAMYGSQAANGVVVIETKPPVPGKMQVTYTGDYSSQMPDLTVFNMMNSSEELQFEKLAGRYSPQGGVVTNALRDQLFNLYNAHLSNVQKGVNTYWMSEPVQVGQAIGHSLYLQTGDTTIRVGFGGNYKTNNGVMKGSNRTSYNANMDLMYKTRKLNFVNKMYLNGNESNNSPYGSFSNFVNAPAYFPKVDPVTGQTNQYLEKTVDDQGNSLSIVNPLYTALINQQYGINKAQSLNIGNNTSLVYTLATNLKAEAGLSLETNTSNSLFFSPPELSANYDPTVSGTYTSATTRMSSYQAHLSMNYGKVFTGGHRLTVNARADIGESKGNNLSTQVVGFPYGSDGTPTYAYGYPVGGRPTAQYNTTRRNGFLISANYVYKNRYFLDASLRADGTTAFGMNKKYSDFYSVGAGWNVSNEAFLKGVKAINTLRFRINTGISSNQSFSGTTSVSTYTFAQGNYSGYQGITFTTLGNPNLQWPLTTQTNLGVDFAAFRSRLSLTGNVYEKVTDPMVVDLPMSPSVGVSDMATNAGQTVTKGWDVMVRYQIFNDYKNKIIWSVNATAASYNSTYENFGSFLAAMNKNNQLTASNPLSRYADGYSPNDIWGVVSKGIDPGTGQEIYQKKDGTYSYTYSADDVVKLGSNNPKVMGVIGTSLNLKGFMLAINFRYSYGADKFNSALYDKVENISFASITASNYQKGTIAANQDKRALYDRWQKTGDIAQFKAIQLINPGTVTGLPGGPGSFTSRFVQEENYWAGESINIGYDFTGKKMLKHSLFKSLRFNAYLNDIFRVSTVLRERGTDYPYARTVSFSLSASF